jgi:hypothetical protein
LAVSSGTQVVYTVPSGRYARIVVYGVHSAGGTFSFAVGDANLQKNLVLNGFDGSSFTINSGVSLYVIATSTGTFRASIIEFNNP